MFKRREDVMMMHRYNRNNTGPKLGIYQQPEIVINQITDKEGLDKAYAREEKLFVNGNTMYVAGTSYLQDVWDDLKIPFVKTAGAQRYKDADTLLAQNPQVSNLVGHSLGGSSVFELQKNHREKTSKTNVYGTPAASFTTPDKENNHRSRNYGDPISAFDRGAESHLKISALEHYFEAALEYESSGVVNPVAIYNGLTDAHSYDNFDKNMVSNEAYHHQPL
jgi:pimeloyl-ACP methyl ester carboxylesterase